MSFCGARPSRRARHAGPRLGLCCARACVRRKALRMLRARSWQLCLDTAARGTAPGCKELQVYACGRAHGVRRAARSVLDGDPRSSSCLVVPSAGVGFLCAMCAQVLVLGNGCAGAENQCVGLLLQMLHAARGKCNLRPGSQLQCSLLSLHAPDSSAQLQGRISCDRRSR